MDHHSLSFELCVAYDTPGTVVTLLKISVDKRLPLWYNTHTREFWTMRPFSHSMDYQFITFKSKSQEMFCEFSGETRLFFCPLGKKQL